MSSRLVLVSLLLSTVAVGEPLKELRLDYATYNPSSLVLKKFGWLEEALGKEGTKVTWLFSAGSNKPASMARMATTTSSSMTVKPGRTFRLC